jgi:hypothetical protein
MTMAIALISLLLLSALGTSLAVVMNTELRAAANYASSRKAMYATDGAVEIAARELLGIADWNTLLSGTVLSTFVDGPPSGARHLGDGTAIDLGQTTMMANSEPRPWGANNPVWRLFAYGRLGPQMYVVVWASDDSAENDGDPSIDGGGVANPGAGILALRAEAFGVGGAHKVVEAAVRRDADTDGFIIRTLSWQEIRQ